MDQQAIVADLEARAKAAGLTMVEVCQRAGLHPTSFSRWKLSEKNPSPMGATLTSIGKLEAAISNAESSLSNKAGDTSARPSAETGNGDEISAAVVEGAA